MPKRKSSENENEIVQALEFDDETGFVHEVPASPPAATHPAAADAGGMDQLRGILLGPLHRDLESKVARIDERLDQSFHELQNRTVERVGQLERRFEQQLERVKQELSTAREEQMAALRETQQTLDSGVSDLNAKLQSFVENAADLRDAQRAEWVGELQQIRDELSRLSNRLSQRLDGEARTLRAEMVDRESLSAALSEVALRVSSLGGLPEIDPSRPDLDLDSVLEVPREGRHAD